MKKELCALSTLFGFGKPMLALIPTVYRVYPKKNENNKDNSKLKLKVSLFAVELKHNPTSNNIDRGVFDIIEGTNSLNISKFPISTTSAAVKEQILTYFNLNVKNMDILDIELILRYIDYMNYLFKNKERIGGLYKELESIIYSENGAYIFDNSSKRLYAIHMKKGVGKISTVFGKYMQAKRKRDSLHKRNLYKAFAGQMINLVNDCNAEYKDTFEHIITTLTDDVILLSGNDELTRYDIEFYCRYFNEPINLKGYTSKE